MQSRRDQLVAAVIILPSIVLLGIFVYGFIAQTMRVSVTDWGQEAAMSLKPEIHHVGSANYRGLFSGFLNMRFRQDLTNMFFFTLLFVGLSLLVGLLLATLIDQLVWGETFFRTVFLYPMSLSLVVTGTIWRWMLPPHIFQKETDGPVHPGLNVNILHIPGSFVMDRPARIICPDPL
jgi:glucose/mannose transport system permease protein